MLMAQHAVQPCPTVGRRAVVLQRGQQRFLRKVLGVVPISADAQRGAEQIVRVSLQAVCVHSLYLLYGCFRLIVAENGI